MTTCTWHQTSNFQCAKKTLPPKKETKMRFLFFWVATYTVRIGRNTFGIWIYVWQGNLDNCSWTLLATLVFCIPIISRFSAVAPRAMIKCYSKFDRWQTFQSIVSIPYGFNICTETLRRCGRYCYGQFWWQIKCRPKSTSKITLESC